MSNDARLAQAADGDWARLAKSCADQLGDVAGPGDRLGLIYVTDRLAGDLSSILTFLRERTGVADWTGTVGIGVCATGRGYFDRPAVVAMVLPLPAGSLRPTGEVASFEDFARLRAAVDGAPAGLGIVHADPRNAQTTALVAGFAEAAGCFLVGGLTSSRESFGQIAGTVTEGGVSGVLIGADVPVISGLTQGCIPIGPRRSIDEADGHVVKAVDGGGACAALETDLGLVIGEAGFAEAVAEIHVAILVPGSDTGDYLVRNLAGIDPDTGWLAIGDEVAAGDRLMFCRRSRAAAEQDLGRMLADLDKRAGGAPRAGLYYSCVGRGPNLFATADRELEIIAEALGDFPLVGFFGNGEISHDRLYGYTGVLTLFL